MAVTNFRTRMFSTPMALNNFVVNDADCVEVINVIFDNSGQYVLFYSTSASGGGGGPVASSGAIIVPYVAAGGETDFMVTIGSTLTNDSYAVLNGVNNGSFNPTLQLPNTVAGDRTTTQFRVLTTALEPSQELTFVVFTV